MKESTDKLPVEDAVALTENGHPFNDNVAESLLNSRHYERVGKEIVRFTDESGVLYDAPASRTNLAALQSQHYEHGATAKYPPKSPLAA